MKRRALLAVLVAALVLSASALAGSATYAGYSYWPAGQAASTGYSPDWRRNVFYKTSSFDTTLTFIDSQSYGWHSTVRAWATFFDTYWFSSQNKKAHCIAHTVGRSWAACTAYN
jgi:hypothetical protein